MECAGERAAVVVMEGLVSVAEWRKCSRGEEGTNSGLPGGLVVHHHYLNVEADPAALQPILKVTLQPGSYVCVGTIACATKKKKHICINFSSCFCYR